MQIGVALGVPTACPANVRQTQTRDHVGSTTTAGKRRQRFWPHRCQHAGEWAGR